MDLVSLQKKQFLHDTRYHQDILTLPTQDKIKHIVLHHAKYIGKIISNRNNHDIQVYADIMICSLSLANALKFKLDFEKKNKTTISLDEFIIQYTLSVSKMAKACEALDHLESFDSYKVLVEEVSNVVILLTDFLTFSEINIFEIVKKRWSLIKKGYFLN